MSNPSLRATLAALQAERDALKAESESRRNKLLALSDERRAEWIRAEHAEAEIAALREKVVALKDRAIPMASFHPTAEAVWNAAIDAALVLLPERA